MEQQSPESASDPQTSALDQEPPESTPDPETSAVAVQLPQEPQAHPPRRRRLALILSALAILLVVGASLGSYLVSMRGHQSHSPTTTRVLPTPTATKTLAERWRLVDSPTAGKDSTRLDGVAASSPTDAWAWGATETDPSDPLSISTTPLLLHWDGQGWQTVAIHLEQDIHPLEITRITALSPDNAWLVDNACEILHWDGHQWGQTPTPLSFPQCTDLDDITALSPTDIWAVGAQSPPGQPYLLAGPSQPLVLHWNGQQWNVVSAPGSGATSWFTQITALSATDIWAIGSFQQTVPAISPTRETPTPTYTLIERWDGQQWSVVKSPSPGTQDNTLIGITALSPNDAWAVGQDGSTDVAGPNGHRIVIEQPLTMHWDGQQWSVVSSPLLPGSPQVSSLNTVAALAPDDIWAVGFVTGKVDSDPPFVLQASPVQASQMLLEHWDGTQWSIVAVPAPGQGSALYGLARVPTTSQLWAVGGWSQLAALTSPATTLTLLMD